jgi:hypothetical protein
VLWVTAFIQKTDTKHLRRQHSPATQPNLTLSFVHFLQSGLDYNIIHERIQISTPKLNNSVIQVFEAPGFAQKELTWELQQEKSNVQTYISNAKTNGSYAKAAEPTLPCIIDLWDPWTTLKHFLQCTITSIASNFHLTWPKIHGWLHGDRAKSHFFYRQGKQLNHVNKSEHSQHKTVHF